MTEFIIETDGLTNSFKGQQALSGLNLRVPTGNIFGFLGRNGARARPGHQDTDGAAALR
jgi:ABC-type multidrug transport system ATPase subunit